MWKSMTLIAGLALTCIGGCSSPNEAFTLPQGDAERGKATFVAMGCTECHSVHDVELPESPTAGERRIRLGGDVDYAKTYESLVTGIINPSHRLAGSYKLADANAEDSPMKAYNDVMTVAQLIDIVTFLQEHYVRIEDPTPYPKYIYVP